ncbi:alpha/beta hydrolase family protein [Amycolatopsis rifamycinica]|uniref:Chlorophyllase n=1 Tax=Amycolatopsis rifamycinica TaxID=287986 RepID=A0A066TZN0_9PSEU|nr:chlorophyllase [Amycolatopsis rifamycinica]KDN17319.1 chlorophyllase [Amycolatopsis rifamycinica]
MTDNHVRLARRIPVPPAVPTVSVNPVTLPAPDRGLPLELRITAPLHGDALPIVLLSHGGGSSYYLKSKDGYSPLVDFYASHGFAVIQPTHLSSPGGGLGLDENAPGHPLFWRSRIDDFGLILDNLNVVEAQAPVVAGRLDPARVAAVGHSAGGNTVAALLGARATDPAGGTGPDLRDPRISAGVLLASTGSADGMTDTLRERYPELGTDFSHLRTRTLVVYGDQDGNPVATTRGAAWHAEPYHLSPGADALLTLPGAKHYLGGIMGYSLAETDDEDPERLAVTQRMTWAYLRSALVAGDPAWRQATDAIRGHPALASVRTKEPASVSPAGPGRSGP